MFTTRRTFSQIALMAAGAEVLLRSAPALGATTVALQPLAAQIKRLLDALQSIGEPLPAAQRAALQAAFNSHTEAAGVSSIQEVLDAYVLLNIEINPEDRVTLSRGRAKAELVEQGWTTFLVKVLNDAGDASTLNLGCQQAGPMGRQSNGASIAAHDGSIGAVDSSRRKTGGLQSICGTSLRFWKRSPGLPSSIGSCRSIAGTRVSARLRSARRRVRAR